MEISNDEIMKSILADQKKRVNESRENMKKRTATFVAGNKPKVVFGSGTTLVGGQSLVKALDMNERASMKFGNPENIVLGGKRTDWDPNKR